MENKLIASILIDNKNMKHYYGKIKPEMLDNPFCREAYSCCLKNYSLGKPIDIITLSKYLEGNMYTQSEIGQYVKNCLSEDIPTQAGLESLATFIVDRNNAKELKTLCESLSYLPKDIKATIRELNRVTQALMKNEKPKGKALSDLASKYEKYFFTEHEQGIRTGLYELDEILQGLGKGDVTILGARPAVGKSALATQILCNIANKGYRVGYFNLEMTEKQILERIISRYSGISMLRVRKAISFVNDEDKKYKAAIEKIKSNNNLMIFSGSYTAQEIHALCMNQEFDLIVIDYLQLLKTEKTYGNRASEVGDISKAVKSIAMDLNVPVIALSQLNRSKGATDEPTISDLRESGDIEQDASNVLMMWNLDNEGAYKGLKVEKNRQGELGKVALQFVGEKMSFETINHKSFDVVVAECSRTKPTNKGDCPF